MYRDFCSMEARPLASRHYFDFDLDSAQQGRADGRTDRPYFHRVEKAAEYGVITFKVIEVSQPASTLDNMAAIKIGQFENSLDIFEGMLSFLFNTPLDISSRLSVERPLA